MHILKKWLSIILSLVLVISVLTIPAAATGGICGNDIGWSFDGSTLTLSGSGPMYDYKSDAFGHTNVPWGDFTDEIDTVILAGSITHIGELAFYGCSKLKHINFPQSITSIGEYAFAYCKSLTGIILPEMLTSIGYSAFADCDNLKELTIPKGVTIIPGRCFDSCDKLNRVKLPEGLTTIEHSAFRYCRKLEDINIPSTLTSIGNEAFMSCYLPSVLVLPNGITTIGNKSFYSCNGLNEITIPEGVTSIGDQAFRDCSGLKMMTIPDSVKTIGKMAFWSCDSLTTLDIGSGIIAIGMEAFDLCNNLTEVYYNGTEEMWNQIDIDEENDPLINATIHFSDPEHIHSYTAVQTNPTCEFGGYTTCTCACGDSFVTDEVSALGHSVVYALTTAPTADAEGVVSGVCSRCGETITQVLPKLNKTDYTYEVTKEPTTEETGIGRYTWKTSDYGTFFFDVTLEKLPAKPAVMYGDTDGNGKIQTNDAKLVLQHIVRMPVTLNLDAADVDGNGKIQTNDAKLILQYIVKIITQFPAEKAESSDSWGENQTPPAIRG